MNADSLLRRLRACMTPKQGSQARIKQHLMQRISTPASISAVQAALNPSKHARQGVWDRILAAIDPLPSETILEKVRDLLTPSIEVRQYFVQRLQLQPVTQPHPAYARVKWTSALVIAALLVKLSPALFLTNTTVAVSRVALVPTRGEVAVSINDSWQEVLNEQPLEEGTRIRTYDGEASILLRDDAVVRLDADTTIAIHNLSERTEDTDEQIATLSLLTGRIWVQGLLPSTARGITIAIPFGSVTVHEGSLSLDESDDSVAVRVWDRRTSVIHDGEERILVVGEQVDLRAENSLLVKQMPDSWFEQEWQKKNLAKDAVHRRSISHLQHERRAAAAGILPTSPLYTVKRVAEQMDVLLTLSSEARIHKKLAQANTRLNEAAALLSDGQEAEASLEDYRIALRSIATGSGGDSVSQMLIQESLIATMEQMAASLPGDDSYLIKKAVLEVSANLPDAVIGSGAARTVLLVDALASLDNVVGTGDAASLQSTWLAVQPQLAILEQEGSVDEEVRKEARQLLARFAKVVRSQYEEVAQLDPEFLSDIEAFLPTRPLTSERVLLSEEEVTTIVQSMLERIYTFTMARSRENQLQFELSAIRHHNEEGRLLRALYEVLPSGSRLHDRVRRAIVDLRWELAAERYHQEEVTGSGVEVL